MAEFIDVHCHLTGGEYEPLGGVAQIVENAKAEGVTRLVCSGYDLASSKQAQRLSHELEGVYFCAGFHPSELNKYQEGDLEELAALCADEKCVAVGEIGLDYHFEDNPPPALQRELFVRQMELAKKVGLPIVVHSRDSAQETLELLEEHKDKLALGGLMHCYSYSPEMMEGFARLGFFFSFGGPSTFKNASKVKRCVQELAGARLLSETDCPYLTPVPFRGEFPNQPKNVRFVVENMAALRNENVEELKEQILQNAKTLFFRMK